MKYLLLVTILLFVGCADSVSVEKCLVDDPYGFWSGFWHGFIVVFSWVGSLFSDDIALYAVNNNGGWYDFGFMLGAGLIFGGGSKATK